MTALLIISAIILAVIVVFGGIAVGIMKAYEVDPNDETFLKQFNISLKTKIPFQDFENSRVIASRQAVKSKFFNLTVKLSLAKNITEVLKESDKKE